MGKEINKCDLNKRVHLLTNVLEIMVFAISKQPYTESPSISHS